MDYHVPGSTGCSRYGHWTLKRSCGYSLPTFKVQYVSSANSNSSYRYQQADYKNTHNNHQLNRKKPKCWHCQGEHYKKDCPTAPKQNSPTKYKSTKEKQFQNRGQINEISTPASDSSKEFNNFIAKFKNIMLEDLDNSSA